MDLGIPKFPSPVMWAIPAFIVLILAELIIGKLRSSARYETQDTAASLLMGLGNVVIGFASGAATLAVSFWVYEHSLFKIPFAWWSVVLLFLAEDCAYYWFHRWSHEVRWLWAAHINHHSSQHYNLSTALRQTWTGFFAGGWLIWLPLSLIGFHPMMIVFQKGISLVYQFWIHTEAIDRMGPLEAVMNTPSHHRVHHATNLKYLDKNYAGILIIWDRMFGTFEREDENEPCEYGIIHQLATFNPVKIALHEWAGIAKDATRELPWKTKIKYLFGRPGWSHDGSRITVPEMREAAANTDTPTST